ncbi:MAG: DUF4192 family protein [Catenulispora sp.]
MHGNLTADPTARCNPDTGRVVTGFSVAVNSGWYDKNRTHPGSDPASTRGRRLRAGRPPRRQALAAQLHPDPAPVPTARAALISAGHAADPVRDIRQTRAAIAQARRGVSSDRDHHIADLAAALSNPTARDRCLAYSLNEAHVAAAERLWAAVARRCPAPPRPRTGPKAATVLAITAYLRDDGVLSEGSMAQLNPTSDTGGIVAIDSGE